MQTWAAMVTMDKRYGLRDMKVNMMAGTWAGDIVRQTRLANAGFENTLGKTKSDT